MELLTIFQVARIRESVPAGATSGWAGFSRLSEADYDMIRLCEATGRACCRACGRRIKKGEIAIRAVVEIPTASCAGSHAARVCFFHRLTCPTAT
jgi:hypothetical protein